VSFDLTGLYFGRDDAEMDIAEGGLLRAGFLPTPAYEAARKARKHLIIGRKGSGKSAICRTLEVVDDPGITTALVTPDALSADEVRRFNLQGVESGMAMRMVWRYVLAIQVAKQLVAHARSGHRRAIPTAVRKVEKFLTDNAESISTKPKLYESIAKLKGSLKLQAFGVALEGVKSPSEGTRANYGLEVIERHIELAIEALACPAEHPRLLILVDQLEDVWAEEGESDGLIIGLLKAARATDSRFAGVSCVVFLRSDIYDPLRFPDKDKYRGEEKRVDWTPERLQELALARARASLGLDIGPDQLWGEIFPSEVDGTPTRDYVVDRTLMRPRDIIHLCNLCWETAQDNGHPTITAADMVEAVGLYSQWKLADLPGEYRDTFPFLEHLLVFFKDRGYLVVRAALYRHLPPVLDELGRLFPDRADALTVDNVLEVLYDIGFLGARRNDHVIYSVRDGGRAELTDTEFSIHPAFRPALRSTCAAITHSYRPGPLYGHGRISGSPLRGAATTHKVVSTTLYGVQQLLHDLRSGQLPHDVHLEVSSNLMRAANRLQQLETTDTAPEEAAAQIDRIQVFLADLASRLDYDGFAEKPEARYFIRSIADLARRTRHDIHGTRDHSRGAGSGSDFA
jgi:hypothetical protein